MLSTVTDDIVITPVTDSHHLPKSINHRTAQAHEASL
jgi:hypothetical protein